MEFLSIITQNLLSPAILFFALGILAGWLKSDLTVPESISRYLSIYLMMSIGFKGGAAIVGTGAITLTLVLVLVAGLAMSFLQPFAAFGLLKATTRLDAPTQAAVAGHYGSVSIVTFVTAVSFLGQAGVGYESYMVAVLSLMEAPAILSALFIAHRVAPETVASGKQASGRLLREILTNGAILLLFGSFIIGMLSGKAGLEKMEGFLVTPFQGILALFLLDMGLMVARQLHHMKSFSLPLAAFGLYMPLLGASAGLLIARLIGLDVGTGTLFMVLCGSASYIAVPAAMRLALPEAKAAIYLPLSLAITFPFNISLGIPLYLWAAEMVLK
ncbi:sodium-dependent bicarbonate transport family permease [Devosia sp.]|uniref:sodium-dependent bicarbonate transport family permease n=1 Tax=Devosia sp. TaxID=1871048 RepID=UPI003BAA05EB